MKRYEPAKPVSQVDLDRMVAAHAKRERKNRKRGDDYWGSVSWKNYQYSLKSDLYYDGKNYIKLEPRDPSIDRRHKQMIREEFAELDRLGWKP